MSTSREPYVIGQKVFLLTVSGLPSTRRYEVTKVWIYPTTFRYLLDTGYVADHAELRATDDEPPIAEPVVAQPDAAPAEVEPTAEAPAPDEPTPDAEPES
jgi:hypothetical protein